MLLIGEKLGEVYFYTKIREPWCILRTDKLQLGSAITVIEAITVLIEIQ